MKIVMRPRDPGPSTLYILSETISLFSAIILAVYFFYFQKNWIYAALALAIGALLMVVFKDAWGRPPPVVILNKQGILDRRMAFGMIHWSDVQEVQIEVNGPFLCLRLKDPDKYVSRMPLEQQKKYRFNQSLGFKMLYIDVRGLEGNLILILEEIRKILRKKTGNDK